MRKYLLEKNKKQNTLTCKKWHGERNDDVEKNV